jgi:CheY-like chemotaxis protein
MTTSHEDIQVLVVDDNDQVRSLICNGMAPHCHVISATDGADALLKAIDDPPDLIISDFRMPGLDGRKLYEKLRERDNTRNVPFVFVASKGDIEEKLRPGLHGVEDFISKPFFITDFVRQTKRIIDRIHLEKLQRQSSRPGVMQGRLEEMGVTELIQSLEMGQKSCRLTLRHAGERAELYFTSGQCKHAQSGDAEGDDVVFRAVGWTDGEFEIDFGANSDRESTTRSTTGLLMEAMRLMDEAGQPQIES